MHKESSPELVGVLKKLLASTYALYTKIWGFHWNLTGTDFAERHELYGEWKDSLSGDIDVLAERIRQLCETAPAGIRTFAELSMIDDAPEKLVDEAESAAILYEDFCELANGYEQAIEVAEAEDKITSNILQELGAGIQKTQWFLRSITGNESGKSEGEGKEIEIEIAL